ncbi:MAG: phasin family protein [Rhodothalassiaceae bacterium]
MATKKDTFSPADFMTDMFKQNIDMSKLVDVQRRNLEAMMEAQRVAFDGYKTAMEKQVSMMKDAMDEMSSAAGEAFSGKTPEANAAKQMEMAQTAMRNAFDHVREVTSLTVKANQDAFTVLQERMAGTLDEMKSGK